MIALDMSDLTAAQADAYARNNPSARVYILEVNK